MKVGYECASEEGKIVTDSKSLIDCPISCARAANGATGCCEWQVDWEKCLFVPFVMFEPVGTTGDRHAIECVSNNVGAGNCSKKGEDIRYIDLK